MNKLDDKNELLERVFQVNEDNAINVRLKKSTATLDLFEEIKYFNNNEKKFLVFKNALRAIIGDRVVWFSVLVCSSKMLYYDTPAFSISYLKSIVPIIIQLDATERHKDEKYYPLVCCISEVAPKEPTHGKIISFKTPCMIKAQTNDDRYGFGNEWAGRGSYIVGKKYGDAETPFAIIGVIIE